MTDRTTVSTDRRQKAAARLAAWCLLVTGCYTGPARAPESTAFYPPLPERPRIQFLCMLASRDDVRPAPDFLDRYLLGREPEGSIPHLIRPYGMALWQNKLYVCDTGLGRAVVLDFSKQQFRVIKSRGGYGLGRPINVSLGPQGEKYVADTMQNRILVLGPDDKPVRIITHPDSMKPCDAVCYERRLYVADLESNSIQVFDPRSGRLLEEFGQTGSEPGEFFQPTNLAFGPEGHLYVSDTFNARVQKLDRQGRLLQVIGSRGPMLGQMVRPKGIAVDREGRLYVADAATDSVQLFDSAGRLLMMLGGAGPGPGSMSLPAKVVISYDGIDLFGKHASPDFRVEYLIFVSNQLGPNKINVYGFGTYQGRVPVEDDQPEVQDDVALTGDPEQQATTVHETSLGEGQGGVSRRSAR